MQQGDVQLVPGPLYHNGPFSFSMFGLFVGSTLVVMERFDAAEALRLIEQHRVTWVFFVPTMMHRIWNLPERETYDVSSIRQVFSTGAPWPVWLKEQWIEWLGPERIREGYGGTESQGGTSITGVESLTHPGSVGLPQGGLRGAHPRRVRRRRAHRRGRRDLLHAGRRTRARPTTTSAPRPRRTRAGRPSATSATSTPRATSTWSTGGPTWW